MVGNRTIKYAFLSLGDQQNELTERAARIAEPTLQLEQRRRKPVPTINEASTMGMRYTPVDHIGI